MARCEFGSGGDDQELVTLLDQIGATDGCRNVKKVVLADNALGAVLPAVSRLLLRARTLTSLDIARVFSSDVPCVCTLSDWPEFSRAISVALVPRGRAALAELNLSYNRLFDRGLASVLDNLRLRRMAHMVVDDVDGVHEASDLAMAASLGLSDAPVLRCFGLAGNRLTMSSMDLLLSAMTRKAAASLPPDGAAPELASPCCNETSISKSASGCTLSAHLRQTCMLDLRSNPLHTKLGDDYIIRVDHLRDILRSYDCGCELLLDTNGLQPPDGFCMGPTTFAADTDS